MDKVDHLGIARAGDGIKSPKGDEANLEQQRGAYEIDAATEKRLRRKLDRWLITLVFVAYLLAFLDRSNIGNAEAAGMSKDLGFDDAHFQVRSRQPPPVGRTRSPSSQLTSHSGCSPSSTSRIVCK